MTVADYLQLPAEKLYSGYIIMRHDVDRTHERTVDLAKIESAFHIKATYYFRSHKGLFVPQIMDKILSLGHEIGFHYETVDRCNGNIEKAQAMFRKELASFRTRFEIKTVCAHGNPLTVYNNKAIWQSLNFNDVGLIGEAFLSLDFNNIAYFSDSGRTWSNSRSQKMQDKDFVLSAFSRVEANNTQDLIKIIEGGSLPNICVLSHPERWTGNIFAFLNRFAIDTIYSWGKVGIYYYRGGGK
jgi:hypothetical protein